MESFFWQVEVQKKNYKMYKQYEEKDCNTLQSQSEKQNCEISKNPQLRGVNDEISTSPEAVHNFQAAEEVRL